MTSERITLRHDLRTTHGLTSAKVLILWGCMPEFIRIIFRPPILFDSLTIYQKVMDVAIQFIPFFNLRIIIIIVVVLNFHFILFYVYFFTVSYICNTVSLRFLRFFVTSSKGRAIFYFIVATLNRHLITVRGGYDI